MSESLYVRDVLAVTVKFMLENLDCPSCGLVLCKHKAKPLVEDSTKQRTLKRAHAARQIAVETGDQADEQVYASQ